MEQFFNIRYEFDKEQVKSRILTQLGSNELGYVCVADGVILSLVNNNSLIKEVVDNSMFSICDSSWVPLFIRWIYGERRSQYTGAMIFNDINSSFKGRMIFMGTKQAVLTGLKQYLMTINPSVSDMKFVELPFCNVDDFDFPSIAKMIKDDGADIIWVALGAPKQETFMYKLKPYLEKGVMISVGAVFKFYSGHEKRAPEWMILNHLEFLHRIFQDPKKQLKRCRLIINTYPKLFFRELKIKALK